MTANHHTPLLPPIIKWAGGKEKELNIISDYLPTGYHNYYEPFVGGGSVFLGLPQSGKAYLNDLSSELIDVYRNIQSGNNRFIASLSEISALWESIRRHGDGAAEIRSYYLKFRNDDNIYDAIRLILEKEIADYGVTFAPGELISTANDLISLHKEVIKSVLSKIKRMKVLEQEKHLLPEDDIRDNITGAYLNGLYMFLRRAYNRSASFSSEMASALFVFIRNYCYSGMFRYNSRGEFNVPYGGIGYNNKSLDKKIRYFTSSDLQRKLSEAEIFNLDFEEFLDMEAPQENDFIFLDPPYDTEFSTYAGNSFGPRDQERLMRYLTERCRARWMMIIKSTPFILSLYENKGLNIFSFDKKYRVSFMNRNNRDVQHLMITNYPMPEADVPILPHM